MRNLKLSLKINFILAILLLCLTSCYRMPTDDDFSLIPVTNNRSITCEKNNSLMPSASY